VRCDCSIFELLDASKANLGDCSVAHFRVKQPDGRSITRKAGLIRFIVAQAAWLCGPAWGCCGMRGTTITHLAGCRSGTRWLPGRRATFQKLATPATWALNQKALSPFSADRVPIASSTAIGSKIRDQRREANNQTSTGQADPAEREN